MSKKVPEQSTGYMQDWLRFRYERDEIPGFVVAVAQKGKILFLEAYGYADLEKREKMTPQHIFRIASHSKTFTATAIMQLQEQGKLRIDDYVVNYLPWLKNHKDKRWSKVTIRQLLSHGAGMTRDGLEIDYWQLSRPFPDAERFKKDILNAKLVLDNNTKMKYSNYGYTLLGMVIESVSGQKYNNYVVKNIVNPLGLKNTGPELTEKIKDRLVIGYTRRDYKKKRLPITNINTRAMSPATGFYSTAEDLCKYFSAHMVGSKKLLDNESKKEMQRVHWAVENVKDKEEYGLGLEIEYVNDRRVLGHGGGFPGHTTKSLFDPEDGLVVIVLTNAILIGAGYMAQSIVKVINYAQKNNKPIRGNLRKLQGRYMSLWNALDIVAVGSKLVAAYADSWEPFESPDELEHVKENIFKIVKTDSFGHEGEQVEFKLNKSGSVQQLIYGGGTLLPEKAYLQQTSKLKIIGND